MQLQTNPASLSVGQLAALSSAPIQYGPAAAARKAQQQALADASVYAAFRLEQARRAIMFHMAKAVFTDAERQRATDSAYQCESLGKLALWLQNVRRVASERTAAAATVHYRLLRGRTSDYAGGMSAAAARYSFTSETGLTAWDLANL
ncbi:hypothetical protein FY528_09035 [Hymenobacter lutimineralis]|uniref:Uncharacterized protein n=1 Tax=Hymenobacter lutimineralis TaxID=2606448 RepID=A0A5D6V4R1_9BACT|nr:hypothetical protein [Hymenobacter lutimineralis]TYZ10596.1 hypothetical protein FY528_09035 [Hymenobacter lutimineralis]